MVKSAVQVCIRTRPTSNFAGDNLKIDPDTKAITVHFPKAAGQTVNNQQEDWSFKFDGVLHNATQEAVYEACARDIVDSVLEGYNGTILAYGQTGAGKTFTMSGGTQSYKYRGLIPRSISEVFRHIRAHPESAYLVRISYLEIYNECYFDLLADDGGSMQDLSVVDDDQGQVLVRELTQALATSEEDALNLLFAGDTNRAIGEHHMNKQSSRSHCVFTMHLERRSRVESSEKLVVSKLNLVDLAGSERVKKTGSSGATLQEAKYINKSLTFLEQVVLALSEKNRDHIPFRQSKLTNVLRDSLGGNCRTRLVANIWSEAAQLEETLSTLKFATRMMRVSNEATINVQLDPDLLLKKYEREIRELKKELALHDMLANRGTVSYEEYTPEQQQELQLTVQRYARGELDDIELVNLRQMKEVLRQFKLYCQSLESRAASDVPAGRAVGPAEISISAPSPVPPAAAKGQPSKAAEAAPSKPNVTVSVVGDIDESAGGFHIGIAPSDSAPAPSPASKGPAPSSPTVKAAAQSSPRGGQSLRSPTAKAEAPVAMELPTRPARILSEPEAFEEFKGAAGSELNQVYLDNKENLREKKAKLKEATRAVNELKAQIDEASARVEAKRSDRELGTAGAPEAEPEAKVIDEEEFALIRDIKKLKRDYVEQFNARKLLLSETEYIKGLLEQSQHALAKAFLDWYQIQYGQFLNENLDQPFQAEPKAASALSPKATQSAANGDALDDGEQFDRLEMQKVLEEEPESISFYNALKQTAGKKKATAPVRTQKARKNFV